MKKIVLCLPNGFCAGVERAIRIVELAIEAYGSPIYVNHEIVHNQHVVDDLAAKGAIFVDSLDEVPEGERLIYSAHGVGPEVRRHAKTRKLLEVDATCPLVTKVHLAAVNYARKGYHIFLIGHANHVEVVGTYGEVPDHITIVEPLEADQLDAYIATLPEPPTQQLVFLTQTTLNVNDCLVVVEALKRRFPSLETPPNEDICYATSNRQEAVKAIAPQMDFFVVVGSPTSSNSLRLVEVAQAEGCQAELVPNLDYIRHRQWDNVKAIGVTAGASTPDILVQGIIQHLKSHGFDTIETYEHVRESMHFSIPRDFRKDLAAMGIPV
ncbi:MAG: 4-hydroxy-3-methylbut-2-enyl diphosphate reductase [Acidobacteria bacterium]|nr:4-hydroxy-3-methylbut-2-enyl diphosphate reductase [Acidobacteriota bacterium]